MSLDKILVTRSSLPEMEEYIEEIKALWENHWLTNMGVKHNQLKDMLIKYLHVNHLEMMSNGHMALEMALQAMKLKGEVITTPFTFASTTHAIVRNGLEPVFCDIERDRYTIDPEKIESLITERTCAILPVHVYGNVCDVEAIQKIADTHGLKVIYDAAHAFGEIYKDKGIGTFGDVSMFSFHATKVFNTIEGGAVCFKDADLELPLYELKNFGIHNAEEVRAVGANAKMNEFCAAMGICNLRHLEEEIAKRKSVYEKYMKELSSVQGLKLNPVQENVVSNYAYFPIVIEDDFGCDRDMVCQKLAENNIVARKYFYPLINEYACYCKKHNSADTPIAKDISMRVLTLPMYADLEMQNIERICEIIKSLKQ